MEFTIAFYSGNKAKVWPTRQALDISMNYKKKNQPLGSVPKTKINKKTT